MPVHIRAPISITLGPTKASQQEAVVDLYNQITFVTKQANSTLAALNTKKREGEQHYATEFSNAIIREKFKKQDKKFMLLTDMVAKLNAYVLELEDFEEKFRPQWKKLKKSSWEERERFLKMKAREIASVEARFKQEALESREVMLELKAAEEHVMGEDDGVVGDSS